MKHSIKRIHENKNALQETKPKKKKIQGKSLKFGSENLSIHFKL